MIMAHRARDVRRCCSTSLSIGAYPVWSSIAIVCSMLVLWAVTVHWEELS